MVHHKSTSEDIVASLLIFLVAPQEYFYFYSRYHFLKISRPRHAKHSACLFQVNLYTFNMTRIEQLKAKVEELYQVRNPNRAEWADWLADNHIFVVSEYAGKFADKYGANKDLCMAAAMLHDIADSVMVRENSEHEEKSYEMARALLRATGFTEKEIVVIVDDAIRFHGCHDGNNPKSLEGKVMAAADGLAHIKTNFYDFALQRLKTNESPEEIRNWAIPKIERDYRKKISFPEIREE